MGTNILNDVGMYIIDKNYKILYKNEVMSSMYPDIEVGDICYRAYGKQTSSCSRCPIFTKDSSLCNPLRKEWIEVQAAKMVLPEYGECYAIQLRLKQSLNPVNEEGIDEDELNAHIAELVPIKGKECLVGGYCEEGFPLFYVNDNMVSMLGYDSKEEFADAIEGMVIHTIHPDDREKVQNDLGSNYYPGMTYKTIYRMPRKDGTWFWTVDRGKVIETEGGRLAIISVCHDMYTYMEGHEILKQRNKELLKKELMSVTMMNNMPSGYHICAAEEGCPFLFIGSNFESIVGWTKEEIVSEFDNLYQNLVWPEDIGAMQTYSDMLKKRGHGNSYSSDIYRVKRKGGGYRWVSDSTMFVDLGEDSFFQATIVDITDFIETQNRQKEELKVAMQRLEEANNAKTQFLSSMSHDIRTPMNAIIGMTTLAFKHLDDAEYMKNCLSKMSLASKHLLTLINDVLDISKVESGKMSLNPIVFSLAETVSSLVNIVRSQISSKRQNFDVRVHNIQQEYLFADELRLNQILINILTNAVKYTPEGGRISMSLKEEQIEGSPNMVRIIYIVEDNGIGMSKEFQENMYSSFVRANNNSFGNVQGTGLGLTICKSMIDLMGGTIECESEIGKGTKFTIMLDLPVADKIMEDLMLPPMEVLLVDDDEIFLESAADTLRTIGMLPECVNNGKAAVAATLEHHQRGNDYPVIIVDWQMPEMDGLDTIREIRTKVGDEVSIIVVSAYEWTDIEKEAIEAGADGFISKPFFPSSVYENMVSILGLDAEKKGEEEYTFDTIEGMHVLIAEDNDLNWEIAKEILDMYGVTTVRAENGQECVDILNRAKEGEFDLVLMDIRMPVLNGYEATKVIRGASREYVKNIPVVAMTADAFSEDIQKCMDVGMNAHIAKPISVNNLLSVLGNLSGQIRKVLH